MTNHDNDNDNQIRKFKCNKCTQTKFVLKKVANKQHHGFACEECWTTIENKQRYSGCLIA